MFCARIVIKHEENAEFENEQIEVPGLVGNVAVARVWRTSQTAHAIKHEEKQAFPYGVWHGKGECRCGSSFVHIEGVCGGGGINRRFMLPPSFTHI